MKVMFLIREKWGLLSFIVFAASALVLICWFVTDFHGEQEYRHMIRVSVRSAWPLLMMVFVASSLVRLNPGKSSAWLLRNRKYIGLAFSAIMLWQILFIFLLIRTGATLFPPGPAALFIVSDLIGNTLLLLMTVTSFDKFKHKLTPNVWKRLHKTGIYYIWAIYLYSWPIGIYFSRNDSTEVAGYSLLFFVTLTAGILRLVAWRKANKRISNEHENNID